jgi:beta-glucosidase
MLPFEERKERVEQFVENLISQLTTDEKLSLCHAASKFANASVERLGIPEMTMSDGPHGVRQEISKDSWDPAGLDDDHSTYLPTGIAQAATWSRSLLADCGSVLGAEARDRGKDIILGPGFNIIRTPLCGRNFEYYSEDPYLIQELAVPAVQGIQAQDTAACVKHFAANSQEMNRFGTDVAMDERTLREIYLPGFEATVQAGEVLTVMGAYNKFRGQYCCHHQYLVNEILKGEWGFKGTYISDWSGVHSTSEAVEFGMDLEMGTSRPYAEYYLGADFKQGLQSGVYTEDQLNDKVRRNLRTLYLAGGFDDERKSGARNTQEHQATARDTAREAMVLLKNDNSVLPLNSKAIRKLAVIGKNAVTKHSNGGHSSAVKCLYEVTPLEGIREYLSDSVELVYEPGYSDGEAGLSAIPTEYLATVDEGSGVKGWSHCYYANHQFKGPVVWSEYTEVPRFKREDFAAPAGVDGNFHSAVYRATLVVPQTGDYLLSFVTDGDVSLKVDDVLLADTNALTQRETRKVTCHFEVGQSYELELSYKCRESMYCLYFGWVPCWEDEAEQSAEFSNALAIAQEADAVIFCGGLTHRDDLEGQDRQHLSLPDEQDALIEALLQVNPNTVITLVGGSPVQMPWVEQAKSVLWMWYAGMEGGHAAAELIFGAASPSGRLPMTFPNSLEESPAHHLGTYEFDKSVYSEGLQVGYRYYTTQSIQPLFAFGHGLTYAEFEYSNLQVMAGEGDCVIQVSLDVSNLGKCAAKEVVQLYLQDVEASVFRPKLELKGFDKIELAVGETQRVRFELSLRDLSFYDVAAGQWTAEPGEFIVHLGRSSVDIRLRQSIVLEDL